MQRVFILLEGSKVDINKFKFNNKDVIICADGGIKRILNKNLKSKIVYIGDFDSVNENIIKKYKFEINKFPKDKDKTDGELAIKYACEKFDKNTKKIIIGGITDRLDHTFGNVFIIIPYIKLGHNFEWYGNKIKCYISSKSFSIRTKLTNKVSLIALENIKEITTKGFKWELNKDNISTYSSRTLRNEPIDNNINIVFNKGVLLLIETEYL